AEHDEGHGGASEPREHAAHGDSDGDRRRRRRGRRGGRRNRRGREGDERFASDMPRAETGEHGAVEPELADAVADFGGPPAAHEHTETLVPPSELAAPSEAEHAQGGPAGPAAEPVPASAPSPYA